MAKRSKEFTPATKAIIYDRANGMCEVMLPGVCHGHQALQYHHRKNRSQQGMGTVENGLLVCLWCHKWIGEHPKDSYAAGWLVKGVWEPSETPVKHRGKRVLLAADGGFLRT